MDLLNFVCIAIYVVPAIYLIALALLDKYETGYVFTDIYDMLAGLFQIFCPVVNLITALVILFEVYEDGDDDDSDGGHPIAQGGAA